MLQTTNYRKMVSMETGGDRFVGSREEAARRLLYLGSNVHGGSQDDFRRSSDFGHPPAPPSAAPAAAPVSAVSRRNARERKRVRLVNLGFSTLRERVPPGAKNKKLSKVETLRAAIEYIRELQHVLGMAPAGHFDPQMLSDENYAQMDDCSSVASSEEVAAGPGGGVRRDPATCPPPPATPSDCSLVSSPYAHPHSQDESLMDIGLWFS